MIKLIVLDNILDLGNKINDNLKKINKTKEDYIIPITRDRFSNGEGKITINGDIENNDIYIISDIGNYNMTYNMHGLIHHISPDEHFQDIKRVVSALNSYTSKITLIMPLLYSSRQHKRKKLESLDCIMALKELENLGVNRLITFDAHNPNVSISVTKLIFDNYYIYDDILTNIKKDNSFVVISPDMGAIERAKYCAEKLSCDVGVFYKRRDLTKVINGKNPIVEHIYLGNSVKDKNVVIVDDMIATGNSILEVSKYLKDNGALKIYLVTTFTLFTEGIDKFRESFKLGYFDRLYTTNLSYVKKEIKSEPWYKEIDASKTIANIIKGVL